VGPLPTPRRPPAQHLPRAHLSRTATRHRRSGRAGSPQRNPPLSRSASTRAPNAGAQPTPAGGTRERRRPRKRENWVTRRPSRSRSAWAVTPSARTTRAWSSGSSSSPEEPHPSSSSQPLALATAATCAQSGSSIGGAVVRDSAGTLIPRSGALRSTTMSLAVKGRPIVVQLWAPVDKWAAGAYGRLPAGGPTRANQAPDGTPSTRGAYVLRWWCREPSDRSCLSSLPRCR
jgi:hypothetical protein